MLPKVNASVSIEENISLKTSRLFSSLTSLKFTAEGENKEELVICQVMLSQVKKLVWNRIMELFICAIKIINMEQDGNYQIGGWIIFSA